VSTPTRLPTGSALVRTGPRGQPFYEAKWRWNGRQVWKRVGPAWLDPDGVGGWRPRRGRVPEGHYDAKRATVRMAELISEYAEEAEREAHEDHERRTRPPTFRETAHAYLRWLAEVKGAKPATLRDHRSVLAEPGMAHRRGKSKTSGRIMAALGDRPVADVTPADVERLLRELDRSKIAARTVNKHREIVSAVYGFACHPSRREEFGVRENPASATDKRREPEPDVLDYYTPEEVEALARTLAAGEHRDPSRSAVSDEEVALRREEDAQDAELVRVAAYAGLRLGELVALQLRDVDFAKRKLTVRRAVSGDEVASSTKSGRAREVPLPDQALGALERLSQRGEFIEPSAFVAVNRAAWKPGTRIGSHLDGSALRRRYKRARDAAGLRPLRFHDLRHTYGSLLAADGIDLVTIASVMGHSNLKTTERYLHARSASALADRFTRAFRLATPEATAPAPA